MKNKKIEEELVRLMQEIEIDSKADYFGTVQFKVICKNNAIDVLNSAKLVMKTIDEKALGTWPSEEQWRTLLPEWFVDCCAPEMTREDAEKWLVKWRALSPEKQSQIESEREWSLSDWLYWMESANRTWYWWSADVLSNDLIVMTAAVEEWPFPWGSLSWLFRCVGAIKVESKE